MACPKCGEFSCVAADDAACQERARLRAEVQEKVEQFRQELARVLSSGGVALPILVCVMADGSISVLAPPAKPLLMLGALDMAAGLIRQQMVATPINPRPIVGKP